MPVTFGTVQLVPPAAQPAAATPAPAAAPARAALDPRDLGTALHHLQRRAARVRAH